MSQCRWFVLMALTAGGGCSKDAAEGPTRETRESKVRLTRESEEEITSGLHAGRFGNCLMVDLVDPAGPSGKADIRVGDLIRKVNGVAIGPSTDIHDALARTADRPADIEVERAGARSRVQVTPLSQEGRLKLGLQLQYVGCPEGKATQPSSR